MTLLYRMLLLPDSCIRHARTQFEYRSTSVLLIAKFVPGLSTVPSALLGTMRMPFSRFTLYSLVGSAAWVMLWPLLGRVVHDSIDRALHQLDMLGVCIVLPIALLAAMYVATHWLQR